MGKHSGCARGEKAMSDKFLDDVAPERRAEFLAFLETGSASEDFLSYLDSDPGCQKAFDDALEEQVVRFRGDFSPASAPSPARIEKSVKAATPPSSAAAPPWTALAAGAFAILSLGVLGYGIHLQSQAASALARRNLMAEIRETDRIASTGPSSSPKEFDPRRMYVQVAAQDVAFKSLAELLKGPDSAGREEAERTLAAMQHVGQEAKSLLDDHLKSRPNLASKSNIEAEISAGPAFKLLQSLGGADPLEKKRAKGVIMHAGAISIPLMEGWEKWSTDNPQDPKGKWFNAEMKELKTNLVIKFDDQSHGGRSFDVDGKVEGKRF
jgi:hypothetical protein